MADYNTTLQCDQSINQSIINVVVPYLQQ